MSPRARTRTLVLTCFVACRSYPVTLFMNIPWVVLHFPLYETSKQLMAPRHHGTEGPAVQIVAGGIAGGVAAALVSLCW